MMSYVFSRSKMVPLGASVAGDARGVRRHVTQRRRGDEEAAVRVRLRHDRAEVAVADGELRGQRVIEGELRAGEVTHRRRPTGLGEARVRATGPAQVGAVPALADLGAGRRGGVRHRKREDVVAVWSGVVVERRPVPAEREPVAAAEHAEMVVEGVVLHHEDDHVLNGGQRVGAGREMRVGQAARREQLPPGPRPGAPEGARPLGSTAEYGAPLAPAPALSPATAAPVATAPPRSARRPNLRASSMPLNVPTLRGA